VVLGYNWLTHYNLLIDWVLGSISFQPFLQEDPASVCTPAAPSATLPATLSGSTLLSSSALHISLVNATAFMCASKLPGSSNFHINLTSLAACSAAPSDNPIDLSKVPEDYHEFADVFSKSRANTLAPHHPYDLQINLEDGAQPLVSTIYSLSQVELESLWTFIDEHLAIGFIHPLTSPHGASILFVCKKNGSLRLCINFQGLNCLTKKDCYPLPLISNLLNSLHKARLYTKIDLHHAYHLVRIAEGDEWKAAFHTCYGSFKWLVMPFGLTNAPAAFQRFMNNVFKDLLNICVTVYLDNILIYSDNVSDHKKHVHDVLHRLCQNSLYAHANKCEFHSESVEYLGYILSPDGLKMSEYKVKTIQDWPEPKKVKDVQSFLGFANFYHHFIYNYSDIVVPLTCLTCKSAPWNFDEKCRDSFTKLKSAFTSAPILTYWIPDHQIIVETDTSDYALAAILSIYSDDGEIHPIAFHSHTFSMSELNYDTHDKELLAIFEAFHIWQHYLEGAPMPIDIVMDHKNLKYFCTTKVLTCRQACWLEFLSQFNLVI
jgi:hypothetical protein